MIDFDAIAPLITWQAIDGDDWQEYGLIEKELKDLAHYFGGVMCMAMPIYFGGLYSGNCPYLAIVREDTNEIAYLGDGQNPFWVSKAIQDALNGPI